MEKKETNALEMAKKKNEKRKAQKSTKINKNQYIYKEHKFSFSSIKLI